MKARRPVRSRNGPVDRPRSQVGLRSAFTLVEVILAIGIAIGILVVALYFYGQAADLRSRLLEESDRLASIRLSLDRFCADLRAAYAQPQIGFTGDAGSMRFVLASVPARASLTAANWSRPVLLESDLRIVSYGTATTLEGTNSVMLGLTRNEAPLFDAPAVGQATNATAVGTAAGAGSRPVAVEPWIDTVHFLELFYWDGSGWADSWDSPDLPAGVEINLGVEPLPPGTDPLDYPYELFRRVIYLPGSRGNEAAPESVPAGSGSLRAAIP